MPFKFHKLKQFFMSAKPQNLDDGSLILNPKAAHKYSLIWMHGLGDTAYGFLDVFQQFPVVKAETKVLLLQAPQRAVTINMGMKFSSWFDIKVLKTNANVEQFIQNFQDTVSMEEIQDSKKIVTNYLDQEVKLVSSKNVFIGGFSQGCCMALETAFSYPQPLGGIVGLSGYLFPTTQINDVQKETPIVLVHGEQDQMIPCNLSKISYQRLDNSKRQMFNHHVIPKMGHEVPMPVIKVMLDFFQNAQK
ncbi:unnamed protein product (macronuclear) [Paramecium tetraurelia]|uniref:Phospholipase/carboxylesterase/thioesterase domain-containing protein n=1 Tax=Paramecium tetraurelia TaxID=5888 RepID=A0EGV6_PARTE|nr:uncharacterized protein GSPATT00026871001 [Paramecium tetraurelia]CAK94547.1 unnamed protein product [Paramecium tetraurelia]|eukprot:XP_001461920.1 hypothetical protein (macronuclear) [Paramecium tetraurelia strain d4-2]